MEDGDSLEPFSSGEFLPPGKKRNQVAVENHYVSFDCSLKSNEEHIERLRDSGSGIAQLSIADEAVAVAAVLQCWTHRWNITLTRRWCDRPHYLLNGHCKAVAASFNQLLILALTFRL